MTGRERARSGELPASQPALDEEDREEDAGDDKYFPGPTARHRRLDDEHEQQGGHDDTKDDLKEQAAAPA